MSYPVDPSELYELRREVEELKAEVAAQRDIIRKQSQRRKKAEKTARDYAGANARALRVIAMLTDGPAIGEIRAAVPVPITPPPPPSAYVRGC